MWRGCNCSGLEEVDETTATVAMCPSSCRRQTVGGALRSTLTRRTSSSIDLAMKRVYSAERAIASTKLAPEVQDAIRDGHRLDAAAEPGLPASHEAATPRSPLYKDVFQRRRTMEKARFLRAAVSCLDAKGGPCSRESAAKFVVALGGGGRRFARCLVRVCQAVLLQAEEWGGVRCRR